VRIEGEGVTKCKLILVKEAELLSENDLFIRSKSYSILFKNVIFSHIYTCVCVCVCVCMSVLSWFLGGGLFQDLKVSSRRYQNLQMFKYIPFMGNSITFAYNLCASSCIP
jgi:hypothetical protein